MNLSTGPSFPIEEVMGRTIWKEHGVEPRLIEQAPEPLHDRQGAWFFL